MSEGVDERENGREHERENEREKDRGKPPDAPGGRLDPDAGHTRLQESEMWNVVSYLISGPVMFGGVGWALDAWLKAAIFVPAGILAGMALSLYLVWVRYGTQK